MFRLLTPIWHDKPETARRVRQRIEAVLAFAKGRGWREGDNPAEVVLRDKMLAKQADSVKHHEAIAWRETTEAVKLAVEFGILTATRAGEVVGARIEELDLDAGLWTVPAARMKAASRLCSLKWRPVPSLEQPVAKVSFDDARSAADQLPRRPGFQPLVPEPSRVRRRSWRDGVRTPDPRLHSSKWGPDGLILQLHAWDVDHHHGSMGDPSMAVGNGVLLWFEVDDFDDVVARARALDAPGVLDVHRNPNADHRELWIRDPDGYTVVIASPDGER
jgi:hypothetical protein